MLEIEVSDIEMFDEEKSEFFNIKGVTLQLEHSLISISKWESKWKKPFMVEKPPKTFEETLDYIRCMTINKKVDPNVYKALTGDQLERINSYIEDAMTATWFNDGSGGAPSREIITSELVYYWMIKAGIPMECEKWHLNRLITLIRVFGIKDAPKKKRSKAEIMARNRELNEQRRAAMNSRG